jgi:putative toxin-antitoxin system antitoxin component (TIGR02293 family)
MPIKSSSISKSRSDSLNAVWEIIESKKQSQKLKNMAPLELVRMMPNHTISNEKGISIIKRGIPAQVIEPLSGYLDMGKGELVQILDMDRTTALRRSDKNQSLPKRSAENVLRVLELEAMAQDTFASEDDALAWLRRPHPLLGGDSPLVASATSFGVSQVKEILVAIKYGGVV